MITIDFTLSHSSIKIINRPLVTSQSKNYVKAHFEPLTDDWILPITAIFTADSQSYTALLDENNTCTVPWEVLKHAGTVNVSAFCGDLHTANIAQFNVAQSGYIDGRTPSKPTPTVYEQILEQYKNKQDKLTAGNGIKIEDNIISATGGDSGGKSAYEIALEHGFVGSEEEWLASLKGADGKDGAKGEKGDRGEQGLQGEKGADGKNGIDGVNGEDGHTPEKGVDYFTEADKTELTAEVAENLNPKFDEKQDKLVSGENIKTINGKSLLGSGNIDIAGGGSEASGFTTVLDFTTSEEISEAKIELSKEQQEKIKNASAIKVTASLKMPTSETSSAGTLSIGFNNAGAAYFGSVFVTGTVPSTSITYITTIDHIAMLYKSLSIYALGAIYTHKSNQSLTSPTVWRVQSAPNLSTLYIKCTTILAKDDRFKIEVI